MFSLSHPHPTIRERDPFGAPATQSAFQYLTQQMKSSSNAFDGSAVTGGSQLLLQNQAQHSNRYIIGVSALENAHLARKNFQLKIELDVILKENQGLKDTISQLNNIVKQSKIAMEKYEINIKTNNYYEPKYFELKEDERKLLHTIEVSHNNTTEIIKRYNKLIVEYHELNIKCNELSLKNTNFQNGHSESLEKYSKLSLDYEVLLEKIKELQNEKDILLGKNKDQQYIKEHLDKLKISFAELRKEMDSIRMERDAIQRDIANRGTEINKMIAEKIEKIQLEYNNKLLEFKCDKKHLENNDLSKTNTDMDRNEIEIPIILKLNETELEKESNIQIIDICNEEIAIEMINNSNECSNVGDYTPHTKKQKLNTMNSKGADANLETTTSYGLNESAGGGDTQNLEHRTMDSDSIGFFNRSHSYSPSVASTTNENAANDFEKN